MPTVLVCDDELMNRKVASKILKKEGFDVIEAEHGQQALDILFQYEDSSEQANIDLILMDLMMPVMDGYEATKKIKSNDLFATIPLIIISALSDKAAIIKGLKLGADEYLTKPFDLVEFSLRIKNAIKIGTYQHMLKDNQAVLTKLVEDKTKKLNAALIDVQNSEKDIISILNKTAEYRDNETSSHTLRVGEMSAFIAKQLQWNETKIELMRLAAPMHDMGKVGIEDKILLKPGKLNQSEFEIMKKHAEIGYSILSQKQTPLLQLAAEIAHSHHEKYNGSGYPQGLSGNQIPQSGAIVAVCDVFDALLSIRPYKKSFTLEQTLDILKTDRGTHFNPQIIDVFLQYLDEIIEIRTNADES